MKRNAVIAFIICGVVAGLGAVIGKQGRDDVDRSAAAEPSDFDVPLSFEVDVEGVQEVSGLAISRRSRGFIYAHEDSGNAKRLLVLDHLGKPRCFYELSASRNFDWEDMAVANEPRTKRSFVVIGDLGRNLKELGVSEPRFVVTLEPDVGADLAALFETSSKREKREQQAGLPRLRTKSANEWRLSYAGLEPNDYPDIEALWFDPVSQRFGLVAKTTRDRAEIWSVTPPEVWDRDASLVASRVAYLPVHGSKRKRMVTSACFEQVTRRVVLTTYDEVHVLEAPELGVSPVAALVRVDSQRLPLPFKGQVEASTVLDPGRVLVAAEGRPARFAVVALPRHNARH